MQASVPIKLILALVLLGASLVSGVAPTRADNYPLVIKHAFGETVLERKPERIATVAWANHEVPLALGVVPVGFARANFGDDDGDGVLPWVKAKLDELGEPIPTLFDEGDGIDFEAVAASQPDVILAAYSGLNQADYETLSQIAPVIAFPQSPWATDWRDMIRLNSAGMGVSSEGDKLVAKLEAEIGDIASSHPSLKGKSAMFVTHLNATDLSTINFYTTNDTRVSFFHDLGLTSPKSIVDASKPGQFSGSISAERIDLFEDVDIIVTYGGPELLEALQKSPLLSKLSAVENEAIVMLGRDPVGTASNPTPLSISWILKDYAAMLAEAADKTK